MVTSGGTIIQQTMHFDDDTGKTAALRSENAHDYRYFPDPDLKPLIVTQSDIDAIKEKMVEHPDDMKRRYSTELNYLTMILKCIFKKNHYFYFLNLWYHN